MTGHRLTPILSSVAMIAIGLTACDNSQTRGAEPAGEKTLEGDYVLVALRRSSHVESTLGADAGAFSIGDRVSFGDGLDWLGGVSCDNWATEPIDQPVVMLDDPNLSDVTLAPLDMEPDPANLGRSLRLTCNGEPLADLREVDARVLVMHGPSGALNAVLQKPLNEEQIRRLQAQLKDMKFYSGEATGELDDDTLSAIAHYAEYRGAEYVFADPVITVNLLDRLGVLED